ncbi:MAG: PIN domain-containing protein [Pseudomonadales bacterium]
MTQPVYLIDASIYIFRAWFAIPDGWYSPEGYSVNALYGYTQLLLKFLQIVRPTRVAAAYDESLGSCFRNEIYPDYKSSRALPDEALAFQLAACKSLTEIMGITSLASVRYEADDIIATLASRAQQRGLSASARQLLLVEIINE